MLPGHVIRHDTSTTKRAPAVLAAVTPDCGLCTLIESETDVRICAVIYVVLLVESFRGHLNSCVRASPCRLCSDPALITADE